MLSQTCMEFIIMYDMHEDSDRSDEHLTKTTWMLGEIQ